MASTDGSGSTGAPSGLTTPASGAVSQTTTNDPPEISWSLAFAQANERTYELEYEWEGHEVPKAVYEALIAPYRGQRNFGKSHSYLLSLFTDTAVFVPPSYDVPTVDKNVRTTLTCTFDSNITTTVKANRINSGKLLPKVLASDDVPDEVKERHEDG